MYPRATENLKAARGFAGPARIIWDGSLQHIGSQPPPPAFPLAWPTDYSAVLLAQPRGWPGIIYYTTCWRRACKTGPAPRRLYTGGWVQHGPRPASTCRTNSPGVQPSPVCAHGEPSTRASEEGGARARGRGHTRGHACACTRACSCPRVHNDETLTPHRRGVGFHNHAIHALSPPSALGRCPGSLRLARLLCLVWATQAKKDFGGQETRRHRTQPTAMQTSILNLLIPIRIGRSRVIPIPSEDTRTRGHEDARTRGREDTRTRGREDTRTRGPGRHHRRRARP